MKYFNSDQLTQIVCASLAASKPSGPETTQSVIHATINALIVADKKILTGVTISDRTCFVNDETHIP